MIVERRHLVNCKTKQETILTLMWSLSQIHFQFRNSSLNLLHSAPALSPPMCCCGRDKKIHSQESIPVEETPAVWTATEHTKPTDPKCFGTITFCGFGQEASKNAPVSADQILVLKGWWHYLLRYVLISECKG